MNIVNTELIVKEVPALETAIAGEWMDNEDETAESPESLEELIKNAKPYRTH